ncbi:MAG: tRNA (adenosine(37)-N6)-threonylcarbamoyltransferase complex transferase subunit TsaD [Chthoniobacterales bacterium]|nr:tRNA (adenosine(37)-N6)-threonylcarbamoyltransferase complex transferase subunit TsaD [Chthoniobacterales bacterium]
MTYTSEKPLILAIETSCDETAVAVFQGFSTILSSCLFSQAEIHKNTGGVVPEIASREHLLRLPKLVQQSLTQAAIQPSQLDAVAATIGPGLAPALLVGMAFAKGLAISIRKPFLAINHIEGHILSPFIGQNAIPTHLALVVSGGHTLLLLVHGFHNYQIIGKTLDDAAGEAFDKAAKILGLSYPGGSQINHLAKSGNPNAINFPRSMLSDNSLNFSFSGLKTALRRYIEKNPSTSPSQLADICASFQEAIVDVLVKKITRAIQLYPVNLVAISGGVAANSRLRERISQELAPRNISIQYPPPNSLTDNAIMIAFTAIHKYLSRFHSNWNEDVFSRLQSDPSFSENLPPNPST